LEYWNIGILDLEYWNIGIIGSSWCWEEVTARGQGKVGLTIPYLEHEISLIIGVTTHKLSQIL